MSEGIMGTKVCRIGICAHPSIYRGFGTILSHDGIHLNAMDDLAFDYKIANRCLQRVNIHWPRMANLSWILLLIENAAPNLRETEVIRWLASNDLSERIGTSFKAHPLAENINNSLGLRTELKTDDYIYLTGNGDNISLHKVHASFEITQRLEHIGFALDSIQAVDQLFDNLQKHGFNITQPPKTFGIGTHF